MPTASPVASRLAELVGGEHVLTASTVCAEYAVDGLEPQAVLRPGSSSEIADILRFAAAERLAVIPMGGRTKLGIGMPPKRFDLALDLSRMTRVLAYDPRDLTCGVEAGVHFADLNRLLAAERQFLPLAPAFGTRATLGGIIAAGADSPLRHAYGSTRDFLLGVEFITGDAVSSKSGGRVVKNVTGYDLHKLLIGSLGTLAVITRLNFRTFPLPPQQATFVATFASADAALAWCAALAKSPLEPKIVEVLDPGTARIFAPAATRVPRDGWSVVVTAAGHRAVVDRHARDLAHLASEKHAAEFVALNDDDGDAEQHALLQCISEFPNMVLETCPGAAIFRIAVLPSAMPEFLRRVGAVTERDISQRPAPGDKTPEHKTSERQTLERQTLHRATLVRVSGVVYIALLPTTNNANEHMNGVASQSTSTSATERVGDLELVQACCGLIDLGIAMGLRPVIERCPLPVKRALAARGRSIWPPSGAEHVLAERLKKVFDPQEILAPGRFHGGI